MIWNLSHAPSRESYAHRLKSMKNGGSKHECNGFPRVFFEMASLKIWQKGHQKGRKIIHHYLLHAIWRFRMNALFGSKTELRILEGMLKNCPRLEVKMFGIISSVQVNT